MIGARRSLLRPESNPAEMPATARHRRIPAERQNDNGRCNQRTVSGSIIGPKSQQRRRNAMPGKAIHMMIRVLDEARSVDFYQRAFDLKVADRISFSDFVLVYLSNAAADFELELTINRSHSRRYKLGDGYGHLAFVVHDLEAEHARFEREGLNPLPLKELHREGALLAKFFFVVDPDGYKIEVLQQHGRYR
jgi:lactoylglutathione lyase